MNCVPTSIFNCQSIQLRVCSPQFIFNSIQLQSVQSIFSHNTIISYLKWSNSATLISYSVFGSFLVKEKKRRERKGREKKKMEKKGKNLTSQFWYKFSLSFQIPPLLGGKESEILLKSLSFQFIPFSSTYFFFFSEPNIGK